MKYALALLVVMLSTAHAADDVINVEKFSPPIITTQAPDWSLEWSISEPMKWLKMAPFKQVIPSYNGKGELLGSWNPRSIHPENHPTFILFHGGHGVTPTTFVSARWLANHFDANVLVLDSYWSRGIKENWMAWTRYGANMRVLDALAAAKFTKAMGADPKTTYAYGDSQGGWTVLRLFTPHSLESEAKSLYAGGISLYPNCYAKTSIFGRAPSGSTDREEAPPLGPYTSPVIIFTGSADQATPLDQCNVDKSIKTAEAWFHFEGATHAWDAANRGAGRPVDGECSKAVNTLNRFPICRSDKYTQAMRDEVNSFVLKHLP